jgi:hypothetical protein
LVLVVQLHFTLQATAQLLFLIQLHQLVAVAVQQAVVLVEILLKQVAQVAVAVLMVALTQLAVLVTRLVLHLLKVMLVEIPQVLLVIMLQVVVAVLQQQDKQLPQHLMVVLVVLELPHQLLVHL